MKIGAPTIIRSTRPPHCGDHLPLPFSCLRVMPTSGMNAPLLHAHFSSAPATMSEQRGMLCSLVDLPFRSDQPPVPKVVHEGPIIREQYSSTGNSSEGNDVRVIRRTEPKEFYNSLLPLDLGPRHERCFALPPKLNEEAPGPMVRSKLVSQQTAVDYDPIPIMEPSPNRLSLYVSRRAKQQVRHICVNYETHVLTRRYGSAARRRSSSARKKSL